MIRAVVLVVMLHCAAIAYAQVDVSDRVGPVVNKELVDQVFDTTKIFQAVGPVIEQFEAISGCSYPDAERDILRYKVNRAPDGTRVRNVKIINEYSDGAAGTTIFESPPTRSSGVMTAGQIADERYPAQYSATTAFILQATDGKGRTSSRRLDYRYLDPNAELRFIGIANEPQQMRTPEGTFFEYAMEISVANMTIASIDGPDQHYLYKDRRSDTAPISGVQLWEEYSARGVRRALARPSRRFDRPTRLVLTFRSPVENYRHYRGRYYDRWAAPLRLVLRHPYGCRAAPSISVSIPHPSAAPAPAPAPEPTPEPEPYFNAYRSETACRCNDTRQIVGIVVEGCLLDHRRVDRLCLAAAQTFPNRATACEPILGTYRRLSDEMDCNDNSVMPRITEIVTGDE